MQIQILFSQTLMLYKIKIIFCRLLLIKTKHFKDIHYGLTFNYLHDEIYEFGLNIDLIDKRLYNETKRLIPFNFCLENFTI